ncbi:HAMP domain-containing sensor histidine kinase [Massilia sp. MS-15]|uniref:sensor histidine kinase n=1 Tax=Massilia sp. MS-15 TaxID=2878200 RepID=UPI001CD753BB|nr:HAMP domain-containing sensor histidine kinase [Massilia sp. MS-15]MCA1245176.1 HAMP domain-containing histidine kinase [Massilia sp. MS-15]
MRRADSLKRRIVIAFVLFGLGASALFAAIAAIAVEGIEVQLVDKRLEAAVAWAAPRHTAGLDVDMPAGLRFQRGAAIPAPLRGLADGVHKVDVGPTRLHVLAGHDAQGGWVLVDHESDYDKIELVVYSMFAAVFVGFMLLATLLGGFLGTRVVTPIRELAQAVGQDSVPPALTGRKDELGVLARALQAHTAELRAFLDRERYFTGDVSHELRSPLTVIMGAAEILLQDAPPALRAPAERIYRAAREAAECVTVLLLLARSPELGSQAPVDLARVARDEADKYRSLVAGKPVALRFEESAALAVRAPRELCAAAIGNLVRNACQYTDAGEVVLRVLPGRVVVEDTGPGLPPAVVATLGSGGGVPSSGSGGTGLGLALARRICDFLGASFAYEARAEGGSRFTIGFAPDPGSRRPNVPLTGG